MHVTLGGDHIRDIEFSAASDDPVSEQWEKAARPVTDCGGAAKPLKLS